MCYIYNAMKTTRHKWKEDADYGRPDKSSKTCLICGLKAFHESAYGFKFTIWKKNGKEYNSLNGDKMPKCEEFCHEK
jgi:hypothetical protein